MTAEAEELVSTKSLRLAIMKGRLEGLRFDTFVPRVAEALVIGEHEAWDLVDGITGESLGQIGRAVAVSIGECLRTCIDGEDPLPEPPQRQWPFPCPVEDCDGGSDTQHGLDVHMGRAHSPSAPARPAARRLNGHRPSAGTAPPEADPEVAAIGYTIPLLEVLDPAGRRRVIDYLARRFVGDPWAAERRLQREAVDG